MKQFVLFTTGRAGSTALMDRLESFDDIYVPNKQMPCRDNEILNPEYVEKYIRFYEAKGFRIGDDLSLINAFFKLSNESSYAGFKSMPNRHKNLRTLINSEELTFITLDRRDLASTVASFIIAIDKNTWRREGGEQVYSFEFGGDYIKRARSHLGYVMSSNFVLKQIPNAIRLTYEDLCLEGFNDAHLNSFFGRVITLDKLKTPTKAEHYVRNWDSFKSYIDEQADLIGESLRNSIHVENT